MNNSIIEEMTDLDDSAAVTSASQVSQPEKAVSNNSTNHDGETAAPIKGKYLPVGTVVMLRGGKKRVMISGFCVYSDKDNTKMFDYCGCLYPEGFLSADKSLIFNHDQIVKVYHLGLIDEEEITFKGKLKEIIGKLNSTK